jgi:hypothetical protein
MDRVWLFNYWPIIDIKIKPRAVGDVYILKLDPSSRGQWDPSNRGQMDPEQSGKLLDPSSRGHVIPEPLTPSNRGNY